MSTGDFSEALGALLGENAPGLSSSTVVRLKQVWYVHGDNVADSPPVYKEYWYAENRSVPVPAGEWFRMHVFLHRSNGPDGRFLWSIDGQPIVDRRGPNRRQEAFNRCMPFTLYTNADALDIWVDDIEVWDGLP